MKTSIQIQSQTVKNTTRKKNQIRTTQIYLLIKC